MGITEWRPDTCDCLIHQDPPWVWVATIKTCKLHVGMTGQAHLDAIRAHRLPFVDRIEDVIPKIFLDDAENAGVSVRGWAFQKGRTDIQMKLDAQDAASQARRDERQRIRDLP